VQLRKRRKHRKQLDLLSMVKTFIQKILFKGSMNILEKRISLDAKLPLRRMIREGREIAINRGMVETKATLMETTLKNPLREDHRLWSKWLSSYMQEEGNKMKKMRSMAMKRMRKKYYHLMIKELAVTITGIREEEAIMKGRTFSMSSLRD
jgi:hypothetical protein